MSTTAIEQVVSELEELPESDQQAVLGFLRALKHKHGFPTAATPTLDFSLVDIERRNRIWRELDDTEITNQRRHSLGL